MKAKHDRKKPARKTIEKLTDEDLARIIGGWTLTSDQWSAV